jgi:hypothetical protein
MQPDSDFFISDWLRNRNAIEYPRIWERVYNPRFNDGEFGMWICAKPLTKAQISMVYATIKSPAISLAVLRDHRLIFFAAPNRANF